VSDVEFEASLAELRDLAKTLGFQITATFTQKRSSFDATAYMGTGKRDEIRKFVDSEPAPGTFEKPQHAAADSDAGKIDTIFVDHEISPSQARNLEK
jgi:GTP-binding protein HflX